MATVTKVEEKKSEGTLWRVYYEWTTMSSATRTGKYDHGRKDVPAVGTLIPIVSDRDITSRHRKFPMTFVRVADSASTASPRRTGEIAHHFVLKTDELVQLALGNALLIAVCADPLGPSSVSSRDRPRNTDLARAKVRHRRTRPRSAARPCRSGARTPTRAL